jgi:Undecaprenyl-phosphate glucose phosphotransferase
VIILGYGELARELWGFFISHPEHGYKFLGFFDDSSEEEDIRGKLSEVEQYVNLNNVDEIYCCLPHLNNERVQEIIEFAEDHFVKVKLIPDYRGFPFKGVEVQLYDNIPVLKVRPQPLDDTLNRILKRSFDFAFSTFIIVFLLSWLIPLISLLIKLDSKGPVFFKQLRHGKGNREFICYKFRTMYINNEANSKQAIKNDPRITRLGAFLRRTSLDEFPQFINVFKGEMSIVGPRPHMLTQTEEFSKKINKYMIRHTIKPGITGLAQIKGYRGETKSLQALRNRIRLDLFYIQNWTLIFDFKIILATIGIVLWSDENAI